MESLKSHNSVGVLFPSLEAGASNVESFEAIVHSTTHSLPHTKIMIHRSTHSTSHIDTTSQLFFELELNPSLEGLYLLQRWLVNNVKWIYIEKLEVSNEVTNHSMIVM